MVYFRSPLNVALPSLNNFQSSSSINVKPCKSIFNTIQLPPPLGSFLLHVWETITESLPRGWKLTRNQAALQSSANLHFGSRFRVAKFEALHLRATRSRFANLFSLSLSSILARRCYDAILDINFRTDPQIVHLLYRYRDSLDQSTRSSPGFWIIIGSCLDGLPGFSAV